MNLKLIENKVSRKWPNSVSTFRSCFDRNLSNHNLIAARIVGSDLVIVSMTKNPAFYMEAERFHIHRFFMRNNNGTNICEVQVIQTRLLKNEIITELFKFYGA